MDEKIKILFVDDEMSLLQSLKRMVRPMRKEWDVEFANSGKEALEKLSEASFDLIVSDMRMPLMDGAELLNEVKKRSPETIRFILSGQTEREAFFRAVGAMHQFLSKPCEFEDLKLAINKAIALKKLLSNSALKQLIQKIDSVPALPDLYCELIETLKTNDSLENIAEIVSKDVGMTAKILQVANSPFFGVTEKVDEVSQAVQVLGLDMIQTLVLSYQIFSKFDQETIQKFDLEKVWNHCLSVGQRALKIAQFEKLHPEMEKSCLTAGLLHELGVLVMASNLPVKYKEALELEKGGMSQIEAEKEVFGGTHPEVGAYLAALWGLPNLVVEAIAYYSFPSKCEEKNISPLTFIHVAKYLEQDLREEGANAKEMVLDEKYLKELNIFDRLPQWKTLIG